jgi:hypothetical protein
MKFKPTPEMIAAAETVFLAKAYLALVEPIVTAYKRGILARGKWMTSSEYDDARFYVEDPKDAWLLADADFASYDAQCKAARVAAGLPVADPEHCPLLVAEDDVRKAERALVDVLEPLTKLSADKLLCSSLANYHRFVEMSLRMMSAFVDRDSIMERICPPPAPSPSAAGARPAP